MNSRRKYHGHLTDEDYLNHSNRDSINLLKDRLRKEEHNAKKEHDRRISLESAENAVKMESFKFKLKCE